MKKGQFENRMHILSLLVLLASIVYLLVNWFGLPDKVPAHYGISGIIDRYGSKYELLILPVLTVCLFLLLSFFERRPELWNISIDSSSISRDDELKAYEIVGKFMAFLKFTVTLILSFLTYNSIAGENLPIWFLPVFLLLTFLPMFLMFYGLRKITKDARLREAKKALGNNKQKNKKKRKAH